MTSRARPGILVLLLALGLGGCGAGSSSMPTVPSQVAEPTVAIPPPSPQPPSGFFYARGYALVDASLSGFVSEVTPTGLVPVPGVSVYCDACGEVGHSARTTDASGFYSFSGDIARGGGVWLSASFITPLIVTKEGYRDPPGLPPGPVSQGWREVTVRGDTQFDIELVRR